MNCENLKALLPEYWDGSASEADRLIVQAHLERCPACRAEAERLARLWQDLGALDDDAVPSPRLRARFYENLEAYRSGQSSAVAKLPRRVQPAWIPALGIAAALVAGFFLGYFVDARKDGGQFAQLRTEVNNMRQLVVLSLLQQQNAADRLQGVSFAYRVQRSDHEVLAALLETVNHDPNVNVRLAAVDALRTFTESPVARNGLVQALPRQDAPMVQMALIDQLAALREPSAAVPLKALAEDRNADAAVREHAAWAAAQIRSQVQ